MTYQELIEYMHKYRAGRMTHREMEAAIFMWQESVKDWGKE